jgi:hypothetical protein
MIPQYRDLWRFRAPLSAGEIRRTERWLATARVALAIAAEVTLWMEPARGLAHSRWLYWLLTVYFVHAVVVMLLVRFRPQSTRAFRLVVHAADVVWPVLIYLFATAQRGPFVRVRAGGRSLSLGALGDSGHGRQRGGAAVGGSFPGASGTGVDALPAAGSECA